MNSYYKKQTGYKSENLVKEFFEKKGYKILEQNFTIRGGEIDLILSNEEKIIFVEVKTINKITDLGEYITNKKKSHLKYTISHYLYKNPSNKKIQVNFVFVKNNKIFKIYENERI